MATTMFFEEVLQDKQPNEHSPRFELEFGRSSAYRENLIYIGVDGNTVILSEEQGRRLVKAMADLAAYLTYD